MASILLSMLITILLCLHCQVSYQLVCDQSSECRRRTVDCPSFQVCQIVCSAMDACTGMVVNCPSGYQCVLQCSGTESCADVTMNCNNAGCDVLCSGRDSCNSATINGSNSNAITMQCIQSYACESIIIHCSDSDAHQTIDCNGNSACRYAQIYGAANTELQVNCQQDYACDRITIDAAKTNRLVLADCITGASTCRGITVYCPPNVGGTPQCTINGDEGLFGTAGYPLAFYAINGFQDIEFKTNQKTDNDYYGTMHCEANYSASCSIASSEWICDPNGNIKCNDPQPTDSPTTNPTFLPTIYPTYIPTVNPTYIPTVNPTNIPTATPSYAPITSIPTTPVSTTINPTAYPTTLQPTTLEPTITPSLYPTALAPNNPSSGSISIKEPTLNGEGLESTTQTTQAKRTGYDQDDRTNFNIDTLEPFTLILIMILTVILLCCFLCICCAKQLRKDKTMQKRYGANIELTSNYVTNKRNTCIADVASERKANPMVEKIDSLSNTFCSDIDIGKVFQSKTSYENNEIMIGNDDEVINEDSDNSDNYNALTHGSNANNNIINDEIVIEGGDNNNSVPSDDSDSVQLVTSGQEYIIESDSDLSNHNNDVNANKSRVHYDGETDW